MFVFASGIGKSVFYAYFFQRYSRAHDKAWILMASFSTKSIATCVVLMRDGTIFEEEDPTKMASFIHQTMVDADDNGQPLLLLFDGTPDVVPSFKSLDGEWDARMVCFTSPDAGWKAQTWKNTRDMAVYAAMDARGALCGF